MPDFLIHFIKRFKEYFVLLLLLILSLFIMSLNASASVNNFKTLALGTFATFNNGITNFAGYFEDTPYLTKLQKQNAKLMLQVNSLREYAFENNELKNLLKFESTNKYKTTNAKIISRMVSKVSGYFIISKGRNDSIAIGMPAVSDKGLVGIVYNVTDNYSSVRTFENSLFHVAVKDQRSNISGILNWNGKHLVIQNVPTTNDVEIGDRIVVSELSSIIPPSIPVGIVADKETTVSGLLSNIIIKPFAELSSLKNIIVLKTVANAELDSLENNIGENIK